MTRDVLPAPLPHIPVLLSPLLAACAPISGIWADGTLGAGSYARGLLQAGAAQVIGGDEDGRRVDAADVPELVAQAMQVNDSVGHHRHRGSVVV